VRSHTLVLGTRSPDKLREVRQILGEDLPIRGLAELLPDPAPGEEDVESAADFAGNALAKARFFARATGMPVLADDSGLVVPALDGAPGVHSKRFAEACGWRVGNENDQGARVFTPDQRDRLNNRLLLDRLSGMTGDERTAYFTCTAALALPDAPGEIACTGTTTGVIAPHEAGQGGFGYDTVFLAPDLGLTFAQLPPARKNARSHRARAFRAVAPRVRELLRSGTHRG